MTDELSIEGGQIWTPIRGQDCTPFDYQVIVQLIGATTTRKGLAVRAELDTNTYPAGIKVSDAEMATLAIERHDFHGDWNYTLRPRPT